jgi:hypothetical protein
MCQLSANKETNMATDQPRESAAEEAPLSAPLANEELTEADLDQVAGGEPKKDGGKIFVKLTYDKAT